MDFINLNYISELFSPLTQKSIDENSQDTFITYGQT